MTPHFYPVFDAYKVNNLDPFTHIVTTWAPAAFLIISLSKCVLWLPLCRLAHFLKPEKAYAPCLCLCILAITLVYLCRAASRENHRLLIVVEDGCGMTLVAAVLMKFKGYTLLEAKQHLFHMPGFTHWDQNYKDQVNEDFAHTRHSHVCL